MIFDVRTQQEGSWTVLRVVGDVDLASLPTLKQHADLVHEGDLALDLRSTTLWDPVAFGIVVAVALRVRRRGERFVVLLAPGRVRDLFAESRVDEIVEVRDSLHDGSDRRDQDE